jgi:hypothetical protein
VEEFAMVDTPPLPTVGVNAGNDVSHKKPSYTAVAVYGSNFTPGSTIKLDVDPGNLHATLDVGADGTFDWYGGVRPQLACGAAVTATVTGSGGLRVTGEDDVFCPGDPS